MPKFSTKPVFVRLRSGCALEYHVIVDWMSTVACGPDRTLTACGHYSVVCGLDEQCITLQDPGIGRRRRLSRERFLSVWFDFKRVPPREQDDLILRRMVVVAPHGSFDRDTPKLKRDSPHIQIDPPAGIRKSGTFCGSERRGPPQPH
jgi:hypothetical protein